MFKYKGKTIYAGRAWIDNNHVKHPSNWHIWDTATKDSMGITEVIEETPPDSRLYTWAMDSDGKISKKVKSLTDSGSGKTLVLGVKSTFKNEIKAQQGSLLNGTDWYIIRKSDKGTAVPANIQAWRDAIRDKATEMETAIDNAADIDAVATLFLSRDEDGNKSGILYDWPVLGD